MTADLIAFLRARLREDEAAAVAPETWSAFEENESTGTRRVDVDHSFERVVACTLAWRGVHVARHDPARVLREIDAKRRLLELHAIVHRDAYWLDEDGEEGTDEVPVCGHCIPRNSYLPHHAALPQGPCTTVLLLALPYADHPDYRAEWRP
ncbi:DUF6221 family protein [Streptomyces albidoflavus]|uniref:DUF6221 family protein n=1 Tax=Streptomyces albidoflavus TaxID=1886 RepID=UPI0034103790